MTTDYVAARKRVLARLSTYQEECDKHNAQAGESISAEAFRWRCRRATKDVDLTESESPKTEYTRKLADGTIEAARIVEYNASVFGNPPELLAFLGYDPEHWEFVYFTTSLWEQHTKTQETKQLHAVKYKVRPISQEFSAVEAVEIANKVLGSGVIHTFSCHVKPVYGLQADLLTEIPPIELHLGKLAHVDDSGDNYDSKIAAKIFTHIIEQVISQQQIIKASRALVVIGGDFFNSDTANNTTTRGTQQHNDSRFKKMFATGLALYRDALETLANEYSHIDVLLSGGNHDYMSSYYLYVALAQYFKDYDAITFSTDVKDTQGFQFGKVALFFNHGDVNLKRLQRSIPAEFYDLWGKTLHRELHLGHLHKEVVVDDESGLITRRIGSPTGSDSWHYSERFIGATKKHQVFTWHKESGLTNCLYIPFAGKWYK